MKRKYTVEGVALEMSHEEFENLTTEYKQIRSNLRRTNAEGVGFLRLEVDWLEDLGVKFGLISKADRKENRQR